MFITILYTTAPSIASFARVNMIETINGPRIEGQPAIGTIGMLLNFVVAFTILRFTADAFKACPNSVTCLILISITTNIQTSEIARVCGL